MSTEEKPQRLSPLLRRFLILILKLWLVEKFQLGERKVMLGWAALYALANPADLRIITRR
jgi:hypothetical protein